MGFEFARRPLYIASQLVFVIVLFGCGVAYNKAAHQWDQCSSALGGFDDKMEARLKALQARADREKAREASLKARDPDLAKTLDGPQ